MAPSTLKKAALMGGAASLLPLRFLVAVVPLLLVLLLVLVSVPLLLLLDLTLRVCCEA